MKLKKVVLSSVFVLGMVASVGVRTEGVRAENGTPQSVKDDSEMKPSKDRDELLSPQVRGVRTASQAKAWMDSKNGSYIDYDGWYGAQCVDLARAYSVNFIGRDIGTCNIVGGAKDYATQAVPNGYTRINYQPGVIAKVGDLVVWTGGGYGYGHVAIVYDVSGNDMVILEQNPGATHQTRVKDYRTSNGQVTAILRPNSLVDDLTPPPVRLPPKNTSQGISDMINYETHVSKVGWMNNVADGALSGSTGYALSVEAIKLSSGNLFINRALQYRAHVQGIGWQGWKQGGEIAGTTGQAKRLEAVQISLSNDVSKYFDVEYSAHVQGIGWQSWVKNGQVAGTTGRALRMEAIRVRLVPKRNFQGSNNFSLTDFSYRSHVERFGWLGYVGNNEVSGTQGICHRLEALELLYKGKKDDIQIEGHIQGIGWQNSLGSAGTTGQARRLEAIKVTFKNDLSKKYTVKYRTHIQDIGWQEWKNEG
ncbi:MAG: CHAP domain-containing protein [Bacilli bacterium]|nr:CHAP domain-containing protein [Bacilli bacterium]